MSFPIQSNNMCMYVRMYECTYVCVYVYLCTYVRMYVCMYRIDTTAHFYVIYPRKQCQVIENQN